MLKAAPITSHAWPQGTRPVVSICCITYNQEPFIREAIEGFLSQETNFPVEILIHDDASTDGTAEVVREYQAKYPSLFRTLLQQENQYSKGGSPGRIVVAMAKGRFIALCEGDDYWTSPEKLQLQIGLLDVHPKASGCFHRADGRFEEECRTIPGHFGPDVVKSLYEVDDLLCGDNFIPTASTVLRAEILTKLPVPRVPAPHGDIFTLVSAALQGPLVYIDQSMSVYRKHGEGMHSGQRLADQLLSSIQTQIAMSGALGVGSLESFAKGVERRLGQLKNCIDGYEGGIRHLEQQHSEVQSTLQSIFASKTFRGVRYFARVRSAIGLSGKK